MAATENQMPAEDYKTAEDLADKAFDEAEQIWYIVQEWHSHARGLFGEVTVALADLPNLAAKHQVTVPKASVTKIQNTWKKLQAEAVSSKGKVYPSAFGEFARLYKAFLANVAKTNAANPQVKAFHKDAWDKVGEATVWLNQDPAFTTAERQSAIRQNLNKIEDILLASSGRGESSPVRSDVLHLIDFYVQKLYSGQGAWPLNYTPEKRIEVISKIQALIKEGAKTAS